MMNSLDLLVIAFMIMSVISILAVIAAFLFRNEKIKKAAVYFLSIWGLIVCWANVNMQPGYMFGEIALALGFGLLGIIALLLQLTGKKVPKSALIARILAAVSVVGGMIDAFMF